MPEKQQLAIRELGDVTVVRFQQPRLTDVFEIDKLGQELYSLAEEKNRGKFIFDFSSVEFLSSAAYGKLISLNARLKARNRSMRLCNIRPEILDVFHVCHLDKIFDIREDESDAFASF